MKVRYGGGRPVLVKGPVTGAEYRFSGSERLQLVDPRDAVGIARNSLFRIEGIVEIGVANATFLKHRDGRDA
jgi:hypothetical protein